MSLPSKSPHSSRHNSFSNLFGLSKMQNNESNAEQINLADNHEGAQLYEQAHENEHSRDQHQYDGDTENDEYDELAKSVTFTKNHPLGRILLTMKSDSKKKDFKIEDLCYDFYEAMQVETRNKERQLLQMTKQVEDNLIKKELTSHTVGMDIRPPTCFALRPVLNTVAQRNECIRLFPSRNKFGGLSREHTSDVVEFLYAMNAAHEVVKISKEEFKQMLLLCTTGKPHTLIRGWISSGYDITTIYHYLQVHFDTRMSAQEASEQLRNYMAPKTSNLAKVQAYLMELATRACTQVPEGPSRNMIFDVEVTQALSRCLPMESRQLVKTKYQELSAKQGRSTTAAELSQALHSVRHVIDQDIKQNGVERIGRHTPVVRKTFSRLQGGRMIKRRPSVNMIRSPRIVDDSDDDIDIDFPDSDEYDELARYTSDSDCIDSEYRARVKRKFAKSFTFQANAARPVSKDKHVKGNYKNTQGSQMKRKVDEHRSKSDHPHPRKTHSASLRSDSARGTYKYCSLCGKQNHIAAQGCYNMVDDNGKRVSVLPTHSTCTECPERIVPRLNHPVQLCPYRRLGPFSHLA